jgi:MFS superfamily sulfate permease-like transporter
MVRPEGGIYFANADRVCDHILDQVAAHGVAGPAREPRALPIRALLLDGSAIPDIEYTGLEALGGLARELERRDIGIWIAALTPRPLTMVRRAMEQTGRSRARFFASVEDALDTYLREVSTCSRR